MNFIESAMDRRRLIFAIVTLLSLTGLFAWFSMDRQEDPAFPYRYGQILVGWPGADPERVERLVVNILEEELAQIEKINEITSISRLGSGFVMIGMHQYVYDTDSVWNDVRVAVDRAKAKFPDGVGPILIRDHSMDCYGIVLAVTGSDDLLTLLDKARQLRRDLFRISDIGRVTLLADPGEQIDIAIDPARSSELNITARDLASQLRGNNQIVPGGTLRTGNRDLLLRVETDFLKLDEMAAMPVRTGSGALLPLGEIASVQIGPALPATERIWYNGKPAVALGIVIPEDRLNAVRFGQQVRDLVAELQPSYAPLQIEEMFYQPQWVVSRLAELGQSLLLGIVIVAVVLLLFMGPRLGLLVAGLLPIVTLSGLSIYAMGGGVLHQVAVAGMVIALGMLVDNAIVMVENLQWHLDQGKDMQAAAAVSVRELAGPLATATGTTLAAFIPLLLSRGDVADFTRTIPILVVIILLVSYFCAIFVTPIMAGSLLKPGGSKSVSIFVRAGTRLGTAAVRRSWIILFGALILIIATLSCSGSIQRDFFPDTDRNQLIIDLHFVEGTRVESGALKAGSVASQLADLPKVEAVHHFAGFNTPSFYYNIIERLRTPHIASIVVVTESDKDLPAVICWVRRNVPEQLPEAQVVVRRLGQGPPVEAPVEIRLFGDDPVSLAKASKQVISILRNTPGATDVRHRLGDGIPTLVFTINDAEAARYGVNRQEIADILSQSTLGQTISAWRVGREPFPIKIRTPEGDRLPVHALEGLQIQTERGLKPLSLFVSSQLDFQPAVIEHRNLQRMTSVLAETAEGVTYDQVLKRLGPSLATISLPDGIRLEMGGSAAEANTANTALLQTLPIGLLLLLVFLLLQFNSFRLVGIVLTTVPLAAVGVIPGLILTGQPFSFTATLGIVALVGIVVNNAIVLLDAIGANRDEGFSIDQAIIGGVSRRTRPILLTMTTTVAGLIPLTTTQSTLWPPMAWAIISGLLISSAMTLLVVPAIYKILIR